MFALMVLAFFVENSCLGSDSACFGSCYIFASWACLALFAVPDWSLLWAFCLNGLTTIIIIKVRFIFGAGTFTNLLVKGETFRTPYAFFVV